MIEGVIRMVIHESPYRVIYHFDAKGYVDVCIELNTKPVVITQIKGIKDKKQFFKFTSEITKNDLEDIIIYNTPVI